MAGSICRIDDLSPIMINPSSSSVADPLIIVFVSEDETDKDGFNYDSDSIGGTYKDVAGVGEEVSEATAVSIDFAHNSFFSSDT